MELFIVILCLLVLLGLFIAIVSLWGIVNQLGSISGKLTEIISTVENIEEQNPNHPNNKQLLKGYYENNPDRVF